MNVPKVKLSFEIIILHCFLSFIAPEKSPLRNRESNKKYRGLSTVLITVIAGGLGGLIFSYRAVIQIVDHYADNGSGDGICILKSPTNCARKRVIRPWQAGFPLFTGHKSDGLSESTIKF